MTNARYGVHTSARRAREGTSRSLSLNSPCGPEAPSCRARGLCIRFSFSVPCDISSRSFLRRGEARSLELAPLGCFLKTRYLYWNVLTAMGEAKAQATVDEEGHRLVDIIVTAWLSLTTRWTRTARPRPCLPSSLPSLNSNKPRTHGPVA